MVWPFFDLTRFFGYTYLKDNGASLGVPIITSASATADSKPSRNTVAECYDQIIKDLKNAASLMIPTYSWSGTSLNQKDLSLNKKGKISKWGTLTLLSRAYLYMGKNSEALQAAEEAIKGSEANKIPIMEYRRISHCMGVRKPPKQIREKFSSK